MNQDTNNIFHNSELPKEQIYENLQKELESTWDPKTAKTVWLYVLDRLWTEYMNNLKNMQDGIGLVSVAQRDPLIAFKSEAYSMFMRFLDVSYMSVIQNVINTLRQQYKLKQKNINTKIA